MIYSCDITLTPSINDSNNSVSIVCDKVDFTVGSYLIIVNNKQKDGATAVFAISKSLHSKNPSIMRMSSSPGLYNEELMIKWNNGKYPALFFENRVIDSEECTYNLQIMSS